MTGIPLSIHFNSAVIVGLLQVSDEKVLELLQTGEYCIVPALSHDLESDKYAVYEVSLVQIDQAITLDKALNAQRKNPS